MATGDLIVSVSGIRGIVGESLTPAPALAFAAAFASYLGGGRVVLSRDSRPSGAMLRHAVLAGLLGSGCEVHDLGIAPTPTVGLAVQRLSARGGVQITASHNPAPWNGLKLFGGDGAVLSAAKGEEVKGLFDRGDFRFVPWDQVGNIVPCHQAETWHRERVLQLVDVPRIRSRRFRVMLDANAGAGGPLAKVLLESLQASPEVVGGFPDGDFAHPPEPLAENLATVLPRVTQVNADLGCVLDPDADRLAFIDETGKYIGEELTLALAVLARLRQERGPVVINMSSSRVTEDICRQFNVPCNRAAVGEANVVAKMRATGAVIGGEGNGGVIDPRVGWVRDPFIGMGLVLQLLAETGRTLSQEVAQLPEYAIVKEKHTLPAAQLAPLYARITKHWPGASFNHDDGLRVAWSDRWVHVRPSNTEPIVRVIAEATTASEAKTLCQEISNLLV
jgi:phosphomannomutase